MALLGLLVAGLIGTAMGSAISKARRAEEEETTAVTRTIIRYVNPERDKIDFLDEYKILDAKLARLIGERYGGVTKLIQGLEYHLNRGDFNYQAAANAQYMYKHLRSVRHVRNELCHNEIRWANLNNPSVRYTQFVRSMNRWVDETYDVRKLMVRAPLRISRY